jgi:hypothetical protein
MPTPILPSTIWAATSDPVLFDGLTSNAKTVLAPTGRIRSELLQASIEPNVQGDTWESIQTENVSVKVASIELVAIVAFDTPSVSPVKIEVSLYPETVICENAVVVSRAEAATKLSVVFFIVFLFVV